MEKTTISHLNSKAWYRLVKVLYIAVFGLVALFVVFMAYVAQDIPSQYIISCSWDGQSFVDGVVWADYYFSTDVTNWSAEDRTFAAAGCLTPSERQVFDARGQLAASNQGIYSGIPETSKEIGVLSSMGINVWDNNAFKVTTPIQTNAGKVLFLEVVIVALLAQALIFEGIRRVFYYIVSGSVKPEK